MLQEVEKIAYCTLVPVAWYLGYFFRRHKRGKRDRWRLRTMLYVALAGFLVGLVWVVAEHALNR